MDWAQYIEMFKLEKNYRRKKGFVTSNLQEQYQPPPIYSDDVVITGCTL